MSQILKHTHTDMHLYYSKKKHKFHGQTKTYKHQALTRVFFKIGEINDK